MKKSRFSEVQIMNIVMPQARYQRSNLLCMALKVWRHGRIDVKALQEENRRLKKMYEEVQLQKDILEKQSSTLEDRYFKLKTASNDS